jgi:protein TonB
VFDATTGAAQKGRKKDPVSAALSVLLHVAVVVGIVWIGTKEVIEKPREATEVTFFSAPPPPPPPPKAKKKKKKKKKKKVETIEIKPDELVQPDEIPEETPEEVEEEVEEDDEEEEDEDDGPEGVEGGEEGGVEGGKVGGVKGGVEGGKVGSVGSDGLCKPPTWTPEYPETIDKSAGIYGTFIVRGLSGRDGKWAKRKDPMCEQAAGLDKKTLRQYWHPNKCIFAESIDPKLQPLVYNSVMHFAAIRCKAYINTAGQPWATWWRLPYNYK